ncbi:hypothetical protein GGF37_000980 [Kickxella alabastrina]|nr:hypothetical protein GGF37_000980 [Kickxella alabastrina]
MNQIIQAFGDVQSILHDAIGVKVARVSFEGGTRIVKVSADLSERFLSNQVCLIKHLLELDDPLIKVPQLYQYGNRDGFGFLVIEDLGDTSLASIWNSLTELEKDRYIKITREFVRRLKEIDIKDVPGLQLIVPDVRFSDAGRVVSTSEEFIREMGVEDQQIEFGCSFELSHGDVEKRNIMVRGSELYFIDWDLAGFYPQGVERFILGSKHNKHTDWQWRTDIFGCYF